MPKSALAAVISSATALFVAFPNLPLLHPPAEDAGVFLYVARTLREGGMPYRDVWDHKTPLVYLLDALGLALAGELGVWLLQVAGLVAAGWLGYVTFARTAGARVALVATVAWLLAAARLFLAEGKWTGYAELFAIPLQFGALALALMPGGGGRARWLGVGALGGLAFLLKPNLVGVVLAIGITLIAARAWSRVALVALGGALPLVLTAAWLASGGALGDGIDQALAYNFANGGTATIGARLEALLLGLRLTLPNGLALLALTGVFVAFAVPVTRSSPLLRLALVGLPTEIALATVSGRPYHYYFLPWLWVFAALATFALGWIEQRLPARRAAFALALVGALAAIQPAVLVGRLLIAPDDGLTRPGVAYLAANTKPGDAVLIWGSRAEVLYLADRRSPTRYVYQYGPLFTIGYATPARVDELMRNLERTRPALVIDESATAFATPPLDANALSNGVSPEPRYRPPPGSERIFAWLTANYERAGNVPGAGWPVWRLKTEAR